MFELFPRLHERRDQSGGTLSGGEQQMLAIGRALMTRPKLLLLDEPSMGLSPILVEQIFAIIQDINRQGTTILLVEQNALMALGVADRGYVLQTGRIVRSGDGVRAAPGRGGPKGLPRRLRRPGRSAAEVAPARCRRPPGPARWRPPARSRTRSARSGRSPCGLSSTGGNRTAPSRSAPSTASSPNARPRSTAVRALSRGIRQRDERERGEAREEGEDAGPVEGPPDERRQAAVPAQRVPGQHRPHHDDDRAEQRQAAAVAERATMHQSAGV